MPAPSTIVTLADADGDEFPMRIWESYSGSPVRAHKLRDLAISELTRMETEGSMRPNWPVTVKSIEGLNH